MPGRFIADGCTRAGVIPQSEGGKRLYVEYRPMLTTDRRLLLSRLRSITFESCEFAWAEQIVLDELSVRIVSWTLGNKSGSVVAVSSAALRELETTLLASLAILVLDLDARLRDQETQRELNLVQGVQLLLSHPRVAARDCADCQKYVYDERTGRRVIHANGPVIRPVGTQPPCRIQNVGCPKGSPEQPRTLTAENRLVFGHFRQCRATGAFPDDPIVRRNAELIQTVELAHFRRWLTPCEGNSRKQTQFIRGAGN